MGPRGQEEGEVGKRVIIGDISECGRLKIHRPTTVGAIMSP